ncbi:hypothetical protein CkaCkLH20_07505 [Colletotrichum karsti]|uniref:Ricin B lectin domain-containing protein n=1 Tax=Colletotrichum karsti TaxID=1095194 RepID=A0A9P6I4E7_9PEZI|nr:uncharacterized protein CkaCkLH20_07505 [Colletotrichum karsti]KAF9874811.1 hypothetical protein CkaCkLH20_07505 [Colletotrichum karsti]
MATLDPNAWYRISETRVDNSTGPFALNLQLRTEVNGLRVHPKEGGEGAWQFQPYGDVKGRYLMRLDQTGVKAQLSACYEATEPASGKTVACMRDSSTDASQLWDISDFGSGTFKFVNVANGTGYVLDVHPKSNLFMSNEIEGTNGVENQLAQHWVIYAFIHCNIHPIGNRNLLHYTIDTDNFTNRLCGLCRRDELRDFDQFAVQRHIDGGRSGNREVEAKNGDQPDRVSSMGVSQSGESAPSSLHGVSPTVGVSSLSAWQPASSVTVPPASSFINGQQVAPNGSQGGYYAGGQQTMGGQQGGYYDHQQQAAGGQQAGYYADNQHSTSIAGQQGAIYGGQPAAMPDSQNTVIVPTQGEAPIASLYGQRLPPSTSPLPGASIYGQRNAPTGGSASIYGQSNGPSSSAAAAVPRHQFDHPTAPSEFAPTPNTAGTQNTSRNVYGANQNATASTVNIADFEPMPQAHELEAAEREIVRRQHELGTFHHGPENFMNERSSRTQAAPAAPAASAAPQAELSAYQHGPDTFSRNEAKMLGAPTAELGAYQHGPDTFENEHEAKVLGAYHPGTESFTREREDKVLGNFHDIMNLAKPTGRGGAGPQAYEMSPIRTPREHGDTNR